MTRMNADDLVHIVEIEFLKSRYCRAIDNKEWDRLPGLFASNASFEGFGGGVISAVPEFVKRIVRLLDGSVTVHQLHHHEIKIVGPDKAKGVWSMTDYNEWPAPGKFRDVPEAIGFCGYGFYEERYCRDAEGWRIEFMRLTRIRFDYLIRSEKDRINPFDRRSLISPSPDWVDEP